MDESGWAAFGAIIEHALAQRPAKVRRQLAVFLRLLDVLSMMRHGRPLRKLSFEKRTRLFARIQDSRLLLLRRGFWGVRTLVLMGYYARPEARALVGYAADPRGWQART
jgi:hypothetical protein